MKRTVIALAVVLAPVPAAAHQSSVAYSGLTVDENRTGASLSVQISTRDLAEPLELKEDRVATSAEIDSGQEKLFRYVSKRVVVSTVPKLSCAVKDGQVTPTKFGDDPYVAVSWRVECPNEFAAINIEYDLFFDIDPQHTSPLRARYGADSTSILFTNDANRFEWELAEAPPSGFFGFVRSGIDHILFGPDHILFLVSLLLVAVIVGVGGSFELRSTRLVIRYTLTLVTSFTIAHSITLVAAALGWIPIHTKIVESIIALSIIYVAIENIFRPQAPRRGLVTFSFGLLHGMGFAAMLRVLLPSEGLVVPVLSFNLGVELGQLAIVCVVLPILMAIARSMGADRYRRTALPIGCALIAVLGGIWLIERLFDLSIIS